jgi:hypothetical protein
MFPLLSWAMKSETMIVQIVNRELNAVFGAVISSRPKRSAQRLEGGTKLLSSAKN